MSFATSPTTPFVIVKEGGNFITKDYQKTVRYWDEIFEQVEAYDPFEEIRIPRIEEGLNWICKGSDYILDFGFGSGKALFRCLAKGVRQVTGIEISGSAISLARVVAEKNGLRGRVKFIQGSIEVLKKIESGTYDGIILFNILDNMKPGDSLELTAEANRILKPDGKVLVKLNSYLKTDQTGSFKRLAEDFYMEETGLYLWNLSNAKFRKIIAPFFKEEKFAVIEFKEQKTVNRMFYLRNK